MSFNISAFKSRGLVWGGARPSLFQVVCTFPQISQNAQVEQGGRFLISAAQLPAGLVEEVRVPYFGRFIKLKGDRTFQDWTVTVLNDENFALRDVFEAWQNYMNYLESNIMDETFVQQGYKTDLLVQQFAKDGLPGGQDEGHVVREYRMLGAWPTQVSPINLDWGDVNRVEQFDVTFAYDYFEWAGDKNPIPEF